VNPGEVLPNDERVFLVPDMWELGRINGKDDFGAGKASLLQKGFDAFGVGSGGWHDVSATHNTKKTFLL
jgi:hypothetical protein